MLFVFFFSFDSFLYVISVHIFYGKSEIGVHVRINLWYLICLRHLIGTRAVNASLFAFMRAQHDLTYHLI